MHDPLRQYIALRAKYIAEQAGDDFRFIFGEHTEVLYSCSITWHGEFFIFGGSTERRQISKLNGCTLERIGHLLFDQKDGGCAVLNDDIYLCFNTYGDLYDDYRKCRKAREPTGAFDEISLSSHHHKSTRLGASPGHLQSTTSPFIINCRCTTGDWQLFPRQQQS